MDKGRYIDCEEGKNDVWFPTLEDGKVKFEKHYLKNVGLGDTDSCYITIPSEDIGDVSIDDIVSMGDSMADAVNEDFKEFVKFAFNCPEERKSLIRCNREIVADSGIALAKKNYIMRVIDDEGKRVNGKLKIMGVALKRSSSSEYLKMVLEDVVHSLLDGESEDVVKNKLKRWKKDITNQDMSIIGVPSSCKTLKKARDQYKETGSLKNMHYVSKAVIIYDMYKNNDDMDINPGDKVYHLYTKTKEGSIAFPVDMENIPQWLKDIPIDYLKMWNKIEKAVSAYIKAMDWDSKSKRDKVSKKLFGF